MHACNRSSLPSLPSRLARRRALLQTRTHGRAESLETTCAAAEGVRRCRDRWARGSRQVSAPWVLPQAPNLRAYAERACRWKKTRRHCQTTFGTAPRTKSGCRLTPGSRRFRGAYSKSYRSRFPISQKPTTAAARSSPVLVGATATSGIVWRGAMAAALSVMIRRACSGRHVLTAR